MGYSKEQFNRFSNSKIYSQLIIDLRNILENYSFDLLGLIDNDRSNDFDPIKLDKTHTTTNDSFTFKINQQTISIFLHQIPGNKTPVTLYLSPNNFLYLRFLPCAHKYIWPAPIIQNNSFTPKYAFNPSYPRQANNPQPIISNV